MKPLTLLFILFTTAAGAQTNVFVSAGVNQSRVSILRTRTPADVYSAARSWEAGAQLSHLYSDRSFLATGLFLTSNRYVRYARSMADVSITYHYNPVYLSVPLSIGYRLPISKKFSVGVFGGFVYSLGVGGCVKEGLSLQTSQERVIGFSNANEPPNRTVDFARQQWSFQTGAQAGFKRYELAFVYRHALSNMLPRWTTDYEVQNLISSALSLKYALFSN